MRGGNGDDDLRGGAGNDHLIGGAGADNIKGNDGDDLVSLDFDEAGGEVADGGLGTDTLDITVETDDLNDPAVVDALVNLSTFIFANADAASDAGPSAAFAALGLEVSNFETIDITVIDSETGEEVEGFLTPNIAFDVTPVTGDEDTAIGLAISATVTNAPDLFDVSVTLSGLPAGAVLSAGSDNGDGSFTLDASELAGLTITPPANSGDDFSFTVAAAATSKITGLMTDAAPLSAAITVDAVADTPSVSAGDVALVDIGAGDDVIDGTAGKDTLQGFGGNDTITGGDGGDTIIGDGAPATLSGALLIAAALGDLDGSEDLAVTVSGLSIGATLSAGVVNGDGSVTLSAAELAGLTITSPSGAGAISL